MYLVTWEDDEGMFLDDPEAFNSEAEALKYADKYPAIADGAAVCIYRCDLIKTIPALPAPPSRVQAVETER